MVKINLSRALLVSSAFVLLYPSSPVISMEEEDQIPNTISTTFLEKKPLKKRSTAKELIEERNAIYAQLSSSEVPESNAQLIAMYFSLTKSLTQTQEVAQKIQEIEQQMHSKAAEQEAAQARKDSLMQRLPEIDKELPETLIDYFRELRGTKFTPSPEDILYKNEDSASPSIEDEAAQKIIPVPDVVPNRVSQAFSVRHDASKGLWFGMELLQNDNISWWRERLGWDATMQFGRPFEKHLLEEAVPMLAGGFSDKSLESRIEQMYFQPPLRGNPHNSVGEEVRMENEYDFMSMRSFSLQDAPEDFRKAYEAYNPPEGYRADYIGAFRGFKMNLDTYGVWPTWVAYVSSEKVEGLLYQTLKPTSAALKMVMTTTVGGPFYSPLGIYSSPIARASDPKPLRNLSLPFHAFVARQMGEIDPNIQYAITRPLDNMAKIFARENVPFSSTFGSEFSRDNLPVILRPGNYEYKEGELVSFEMNGQYAAYVLFDPRTEKTYQIGRKHPFATNYYLGGISAYEMRLPFVTFDRKDLAIFTQKAR